MARYKISIEYDGSNFHGWQRQVEYSSVQHSIEEAIEYFCQHKVALFGAGRTDAGVHALSQIAHFDMEKQWPTNKLFEAINGILRQRGDLISIINCQAVDDDFDARFSATMRYYRYHIVNRRAPLALNNARSWWVRFPLDHEAMHEAAQLLVGHHDFTTFRSIKCQAKSPLRTLQNLDVERHGEEIIIQTASRAFLHNQVRSIVGSLKAIGDGKWVKEDLVKALAAKDHRECAAVAPACGLYLVKVDY